MNITRTEVANGVFLTQIITDRFKSNRLQLSFSLPLTAETLAHGTLLCNVLRENCAAYPTQALLAKRLETLYDTGLTTVLAIDGDILQIGMVLDLLDNAYATDGMDILGGALGVLSECLLRPNVTNGGFDPVCLAREQKNACDEIAAQINNKMQYAFRKLREAMFAGEPCARTSPTEADVMAVTPTALYAFYQKVLQSAPVELVWAGKAHDAALTAFATDLFANTARTVALPANTTRHKARDTVKHADETLPVRQGKLCMGFAGAAMPEDADFAASVLFRTIYGASPISKLFMNVREKKSLCYYCHAIALAEKGVLIVSSGVENENRAAAEEEILLQLRTICDGEITEEELSIAKKYAQSACRSVSDSVGGLINWYAKRAKRTPLETPEALSEKLGALTVADIAAYAKSLSLDTIYFLEGSLPTDTEDAEEEA